MRENKNKKTFSLCVQDYAFFQFIWLIWRVESKKLEGNVRMTQ